MTPSKWEEMSLEERVEWLYKKSDELEYQANYRGRTEGSLRHAVQWLLRKHKEEEK